MQLIKYEIEFTKFFIFNEKFIFIRERVNISLLLTILIYAPKNIKVHHHN